MKTLIITFSQTGYTRKTGERIREGILAAGGSCDMVDMNRVETAKLEDYDLVGLGCPVFYYQEPFNVREFVDGLPALSGKHWFVFCSHGSIMGITLRSLSERLQAKGALVVGYFDIYADATAPFIPYPTTTTGHPDDVDYRQAICFGTEIAERCRRIAQGETDLIPEPGPVDAEWEQMASMFSPERVKSILPEFRINTEKCVLCHDCENECPVGGIDVEAEPPRVQDPCIGCTRCVMVCREFAIEADWGPMVALNPTHYAQLREALDKAAAKGEFRWLIDPDGIDFNDYMHAQRLRIHEAEKKGKAG